MQGTNSVQNQRQGDRQSGNSIKKFINDILAKKVTDEQRQRPVTTTKEDSREINEILESSQPRTSTDESHIKGCCGHVTTPSILWYIGTFILLIVAFVSLVLSVAFFINDTTTDRAIKLYGIIGASFLVLIVLIIVLVDCWIDGTRLYLEEAVVYRVFQGKEADAETMTMRGSRKKDEERNPQQLQQAPSDLPPYPYHNRHSHPHDHDHDYDHHSHNHRHRHHLHHSHSHRIHVYSPTSHNQQSTRTHSHGSRHDRQNLPIVSVDPSDKIVRVSGSRTMTYKAIHRSQPKLKISDVIRGTHINQTEGEKTSTINYTDIPDNVTEIIHETTIIKAPRSLLPTLRRILVQQNKGIPST